MNLRVLAEAARPKTLPAAAAPVIVGTAAAESFIAWRAAGAFVVATAIQIAVNYANDLSDAQRGVDDHDRVGPRRAVASGLIAPSLMKLAIAGALLVAAVAGGALAAAAGPELLVVGAVCMIAALAYSGGPRPYGSAGLGEAFVFVFFGLVATVGSAYVQDEQVTLLSFVCAIPIGLLASAILVANNLRDITTDRAAGKRTLAVRVGGARTRQLYRALIVFAFLGTFAVAATAHSVLPLLALAAAPLAVRPTRLVAYSDEPGELIAALGGTARTELAYAVLLAVGLVGGA